MTITITIHNNGKPYTQVIKTQINVTQSLADDIASDLYGNTPKNVTVS